MTDELAKILSWNVNGLRSALKKGFLDFLESADPDVLCLQESRVLPEELQPDVDFWESSDYRI